MNLISVTDLRQNATQILQNVTTTKDPAYVVQHSKLKAVILDANHYQSLQNMVEEYVDGFNADRIMKQPGGVALHDYMKKRWSRDDRHPKTVGRKRSRPTT
jgi:prevent-host-death family protein